MPIRALNITTVKLITSTQIITSVFSVVKELVENSLDADAKNIEINLTDNGLSLIEIRDDGCGISVADVPNMAMPHYTSKILSFSDLDSLTTYGFRGEALNAICRVAAVTITTKTIQDETAKLYSMNNEEGISSTELSHRFVGTTVRVQKLFENLPVRRQMISNARKLRLEIKQIENLLKSLSICQPVVRMSFRVNNNLVFLKPSCTNIKEAMSHFVGSKASANLEWIQNEDPEVKLQVMIPKQNLSDPQPVYEPNEQFIIINNRPVKYKQFEKIIHERVSDHFGSKAPSKKHPVYLLSVTVSPSEIDVNLEPNKTSVLLKNQDTIVEKLDKILVDYYNLCDENMRPDVFQYASNTSFNESLEYLDFTSNVVSKVDSLVCKKIRLNNNEQKPREFIVDVNTDSDLRRKGSQKQSLNNSPTMDIESGSMVNQNLEDRRINPQDFATKLKSKSDGRNEPDRDSLDRILGNFPGPVLSDSDDSESIMGRVPIKAKESSIIIGHATRTAVTENDRVESCQQESEFSAVSENAKTFSKDRRDNVVDRVERNDAESGLETFSQLPVVDLGEDFDISAILESSAEKELVKTENSSCALETPINNLEIDRSETDSGNGALPKSNCSLELWTRGQIPGLKNPTEVTALNDPKNRNKSNNDSRNNGDSNSQTIYQTGFSKFSFEIRSQVLEENPGATSPAIAKILANRWKELPSEERGYYMDLALEERKNAEVNRKKLKNKQLSQQEADKNKARLVQMFETMKKTKNNKKCSRNEKTSTPWDINIQDITKNFFSKSISEDERIIGALTDEIWVLKCDGKVCVVNSREILEATDQKKPEGLEVSVQSTASILELWLKDKKPNFPVIMHPIHSISTQ